MSSFQRRLFAAPLVLALLHLSACITAPHSTHGGAGTLLIVGGGLDDDSRPIYERFVALASAHGPANILIATAATGEEQDEVVDKSEALRVWAPRARVSAIRRATSTDETVVAIDAATAILFTGGDQKRITDRYRPNDRETPEWLAMRRLLARGGVIAGCSAGDAMMGDVMMLGGGSASALGIAPKRAQAGEALVSGAPVGQALVSGAQVGGAPAPGAQVGDATVLGPQVGPGMHFLPWAMTDSHFFERDRVGRFVAALEKTGTRLGLGVSEDGCIEVDLATGDVRGVGVSECLLLDTAHIQRDGLVRKNVLARVIQQGDRVSLRERLATTTQLPPAPPRAVRDVPVVDPGQNRQLASWRVFRCAAQPGGSAQRLALEGWQITAWPTGDGEVAFEVGPR